MKTYKFGIVGAGHISEYFSGALENIDNAEIYAVCSRSEENGRAYSARHGGKVIVYTDINEMCADPQIDVVYVGVPHTAHHDAAIAALSAKKAVICEKPMCPNLPLAQEAIRAAEEKNVFFMEALWTAFLPAYQKAKEWIADGRIGRINGIYSDFHIARADAPDGHRLKNPELAGGALLDLGVYDIFLSNDLMGTVPEIKGVSIEKTDLGVDFVTKCELDYNGVSARFSCGIDRSSCSAVISGDSGSIFLPNFNGANTALLLVNGEVRESFCEPYKWGLIYEARHVIECLEKGLTQSPVYPLDMTERELRVCDEIRRLGGVKYPFE